MLELFQAEWCPYSHAVRERLTELGITYVIHQVEPWPEQRGELRAVSGDTHIPVLVNEAGEPIKGTEEILDWLDGRFEEPPEAAGHREQVRAHSRTKKT